tara:strand:+ start:450 stop:701 length:252 start_codon:yes stop_codon:yes gene_type:complete
MSVIDVKEEWVSEVDMNAEFGAYDLSVSVYVDQHELSESISYQDMAHIMLADDIKYDDELIMEIVHGLENTARTLRNGLGGRD